MTLLNLKSVFENLDEQEFIKVHKSFIVAKKQVQRIENNDVIIGQHRIPISRTNRDAVMQQLIGEKFWKR